MARPTKCPARPINLLGWWVAARPGPSHFQSTRPGPARSETRAHDKHWKISDFVNRYAKHKTAHPIPNALQASHAACKDEFRWFFYYYLTAVSVYLVQDARPCSMSSETRERACWSLTLHALPCIIRTPCSFTTVLIYCTWSSHTNRTIRVFYTKYRRSSLFLLFCAYLL